MISWTARLSLFVILFLVLACASAPPPADHEPEGALVATDEIPGNFLMRQQIEFRYGQESGSFEAVVQKHCDELTVIGFTPFGTRAFSIRQRGLQVSVESHLAGAWPFSPRYVLLDIHRSYFVPIPENPPHEGTRQVSYGGESILERWSAGRLVERSYRSDPAGSAGRIVVRYVDGATALVPARHVRLHDERHGYELEVITVVREELACP